MYKNGLNVKEIKYGPFQRNVMDLSLPNNVSAENPFIILIHGGAWVSGEKELFTKLQEYYANQGIASVAINYRYASEEVHYKEILEDISKAIECCVASAGEWNTRTNGFVLQGGSAGAHLALLFGYTTKYLINLILAFAAPTDFTDPDIIEACKKNNLVKPLEYMIGKNCIKSNDVIDEYKTASPVNYVKSIPTLIVHGTKDEVVPYNQALKLIQILVSKQFTHRLISLENIAHEASSGWAEKSIMNLVKEWIWKYGKRP